MATVVEMLRTLVRDGEPWAQSGACAYCEAHSWERDSSHEERCPWRLAKEWLERQEGE